MRLVEDDGPDVERVRAEAFIEIAEVMGRRGAELTRLRHPDGHDLVHWARGSASTAPPGSGGVHSP